jgi:hypothetical protein
MEETCSSETSSLQDPHCATFQKTSLFSSKNVQTARGWDEHACSSQHGFLRTAGKRLIQLVEELSNPEFSELSP